MNLKRELDNQFQKWQEKVNSFDNQTCTYRQTGALEYKIKLKDVIKHHRDCLEIAITAASKF